MNGAYTQSFGFYNCLRCVRFHSPEPARENANVRKKNRPYRRQEGDWTNVPRAMDGRSIPDDQIDPDQAMVGGSGRAVSLRAARWPMHAAGGRA